MSVNKQILVGRLGSDVELKRTPNGAAVINFNVATSKRIKDKGEDTQWHKCVMFGKLPEVLAQYMKKGTSVYVEGETRHRKYTNKEGIEVYNTEVFVEELKLLGSKTPQGQQDKQEQSVQNTEDDLGF